MTSNQNVKVLDNKGTGFFNFDRMKRIIGNTTKNTLKISNFFKESGNKDDRKQENIRLDTDTSDNNKEKNVFAKFVSNLSQSQTFNKSNNQQSQKKIKDASFQIFNNDLNMSNSDLISVEDSDYRRLRTNYSMMDGDFAPNTEPSADINDCNISYRVNDNIRYNNDESDSKLKSSKDLQNSCFNINTFTRNNNNFNINLKAHRQTASGKSVKCSTCIQYQELLNLKFADNNKLLSEVDSLKVEIELLTDSNRFLLKEISSIREELTKSRIVKKVETQSPSLIIEELNRSISAMKKEIDTFKAQILFYENRIQSQDNIFNLIQEKNKYIKCNFDDSISNRKIENDNKFQKNSNSYCVKSSTSNGSSSLANSTLTNENSRNFKSNLNKDSDLNSNFMPSQFSFKD